MELGSLVFHAVPSLAKLLKKEWGLDKAAKDGLEELEKELTAMEAYLMQESSCMQMQPDQHDPSKIKADEVRDLSCAIEKRLHSFVVRIESAKTTILPAFSKRPINHDIASYVKEIMVEVKKVSKRYKRWSSEMSHSITTTSTRKVDPRMYSTKESDPVGLAGATDELTKMLLSKRDRVSIVGMAGLGKTTLAQAVFDKMEAGFNISAFVSVGRTTDLKKVLTDILRKVHTQIYDDSPDVSQQLILLQNYGPPDERELFNRLQNSLAANKDKRCLFVIDDIWDKVIWDRIKPAFEGNANCRIITTTRKLKVAEEVGGVYMMKPLSKADSKELLHKKIGAEAKSHDTELLDKFVSKCSGLPIAIIMTASLLAKKPREEWPKVYESIGFDQHGEDGVVKDMMMILSFSYYDLPYHLRRCFLYLSLFPEDHWIDKNMLIWRWVGEGLVSDPDGQRVGLFQLGETYFNELIDMSMIQRAVSPHDLGQGGCRVHDIMLDFIRDLSSSENENFSAVLGMKQESIPGKRTIHRLAIHETNVVQIQNTRLEVGEVLSFYANRCPGSALPPLSRFALARVIDLEYLEDLGDCKLKDLGKLDYLEYVSLLGTPLAKLPKEIKRLKFLQTLDVRATGIRELPQFVEELRKLRCLRAGKGTRMMGRVGKLTSLEELWLHSADKSPGLAVELRKLTELRVLVIHFDKMEEELHKALVESLRVLKKLQILQIWSDAEGKVRLGGWEGNAPFPELRQLLLFGIILPRRMSWIKPSCAPKLSKLLLQVKVLNVEDMEILGQMPSLRSLCLHSNDNRLSYTVDKNEFKVLEYLNTNIELVCVCGDGALPRIQELEVGNIKVGTDVGLQGNMPLLERASYHLDCSGCDLAQVEMAEAKLRQGIQAHPKCPSYSIKRFNNFDGGLEIEFLLSELVRELGEGGQAQANASSPDILNTVSGSIARLLPEIRYPPTFTVDDTSQPEGGVPPRRPSGEEQVILAARPRYQSPKGKIEISTEMWLEALGSQPAANLAITRAAQARMDPAEIISLYEKLAYDPEFIAATNNLKRDANGFLSASDISATLPLIMREMISQEEQKARGPGSSSGTSAPAAATEGLRDESSEFDADSVLASFESVITDDAVLASIDSELADDNEEPGMTAKDVAAEARKFMKNSMQNPEVVACLKSLQNAGLFREKGPKAPGGKSFASYFKKRKNQSIQNAGGPRPSPSDMFKFRMVMMAELMSYMEETTDGPGRSQGAEANLPGKHRAENSGAGAGPSARAAATDGLRDESSELDVDSLLASFESVITDDAVLASIDSELADDNEVHAGITAKDVAAEARKLMKKCMQNPQVVACLNSLQNADGSEPSPSDMFKLRMMVKAESMRDVDETTDGPGRSQENSGAGAGPEPTPKVPLPCMYPQAESSSQDGENFSRMLKEVLPTVEQALAEGASSGQPSSAQAARAGGQTAQPCMGVLRQERGSSSSAGGRGDQRSFSGERGFRAQVGGFVEGASGPRRGTWVRRGGHRGVGRGGGRGHGQDQPPRNVPTATPTVTGNSPQEEPPAVVPPTAAVMLPSTPVGKPDNAGIEQVFRKLRIEEVGPSKRP